VGATLIWDPEISFRHSTSEVYAAFLVVTFVNTVK